MKRRKASSDDIERANRRQRTAQTSQPHANGGSHLDVAALPQQQHEDAKVPAIDLLSITTSEMQSASFEKHVQ